MARMMTITIALRSVTCIRRHINGYKHYPLWNENNYQEGMKKVRSAWRYQLDELHKTKPPALSENFLYNWDYWEDMLWDDICTSIETAFIELRKRLHGKERSKMRSEQSER
jgi:hypothetical protein